MFKRSLGVESEELRECGVRIRPGKNFGGRKTASFPLWKEAGFLLPSPNFLDF